MDADAATDDWDVGIIWLTRHLQRPDRMLRRRIGATRGRDTEDRPGVRRRRSAAGDVLDGASGCADLGDIPALLVVVAIVAVVGVLVALGPGLLAITIGLLEIALVLIGAAIALVGRVVFRQPWEVVARRGDEQHEWRVRGIRRARDVLAEIETGVRLGHHPATLAPEHADPAPPDLSGVPGVYHRPEFRFLGRVYGAILALAILVGAAILAAVLS
ncbi:MAG: hypothetical protein R8F63_14420 [Acidimicrobiales bacterium]|nr:hypothetical protein [Acidimicrobiales bacterium]